MTAAEETNKTYSGSIVRGAECWSGTTLSARDAAHALELFRVEWPDCVIECLHEGWGHEGPNLLITMDDIALNDLVYTVRVQGTSYYPRRLSPHGQGETPALPFSRDATYKEIADAQLHFGAKHVTAEVFEEVKRRRRAYYKQIMAEPHIPCPICGDDTAIYCNKHIKGLR